MEERSICENCNLEYRKRAKNQKYCCLNCKQKANRKKYSNYILNRGNLNQLCKGKVGDISELEVSAHFLRNGYEVFKNISSKGPADLIIWKPETNEIHIIDVKSYVEPNYVEEYIIRNENNNKYKQIKIVPYNYITKEIRRDTL